MSRVTIRRSSVYSIMPVRFAPVARTAKSNPGDGVVDLLDYFDPSDRRMPDPPTSMIAMSPAIVLVILVVLVVLVVAVVLVVFVPIAIIPLAANDGAQHSKRNAGGDFAVVGLAALFDPDTLLASVAEAHAAAAFIAVDAARLVPVLAPVVEGFDAGLPTVAETHPAPASIANHHG